MVFKKYSPAQDSIFKIYQGAFSMIGPAPPDQLKTGDVVRPESMLHTVAISLSRDEKDSQISERAEDDGM